MTVYRATAVPSPHGMPASVWHTWFGWARRGSVGLLDEALSHWTQTHGPLSADQMEHLARGALHQHGQRVLLSLAKAGWRASVAWAQEAMTRSGQAHHLIAVADHLSAEQWNTPVQMGGKGVWVTLAGCALLQDVPAVALALAQQGARAPRALSWRMAKRASIPEPELTLAAGMALGAVVDEPSPHPRQIGRLVRAWPTQLSVATHSVEPWAPLEALHQGHVRLALGMLPHCGPWTPAVPLSDQAPTLLFFMIKAHWRDPVREPYSAAEDKALRDAWVSLAIELAGDPAVLMARNGQGRTALDLFLSLPRAAGRPAHQAHWDYAVGALAALTQRVQLHETLADTDEPPPPRRPRL